MRSRAWLALVVTAASCNGLAGIDPAVLGDGGLDSGSGADGTMEPGSDAGRDGSAEAGDGSTDGQSCGVANMPCGCVDLQNSSTDCGACGHSCLGTPCSGGVCAPTAIDATPTRFYSLAFDGAKGLYYTREVDPTQARVCAASTDAIDGGDPCRIVMSMTNTGTVALAGADLYVAEKGGVLWYVGTDGGGNLKLDADPAGFPGLASANGYVFYATGSELRRVAPDGGGRLVLDDAGAGLSGAVAADALYAYFFAYTAGGPLRVPQTGGATVPLTPTLKPHASAAVIADGYLCFSDQDGQIDRIALDGGALDTVVWTAGNTPISVAVADPYIYWLDKGDNGAANGMLHRHTVGSQDDLVLAKNLDNPFGIATDAQYVYFTVSGSYSNKGGVYRVAR